MIFVRKGKIAKILESREGKESEATCIEVTISKKTWCIMFAYRPPQNKNRVSFSMN